MKLGQVLSFVDLGIVPAEHREQFQAKLATLRDAAPTVSFEEMRKVIEAGARGARRRGLRRVRSRADRGRLDRAGVSSRAPRRPPRRRQGPVPGHRRRRPRRHEEPRGAAAAGPLDHAGARHEGRRATRSASGSSRSSTTSSRPPTSARWRGSTRAIRSSPCPRWSRSLCRERVIVSEFVTGPRFRGAADGAGRRARPDRRDPLSLLLRLDVPVPPVLGRSPSRQHGRARRRADRVPRLRPVQVDLTRGRRARAGVPAGDDRRRRRRASPADERGGLPAARRTGSTPPS